MSADLVLRNGRFTTLDRSNPTASAVAITGGVFTAVGHDSDIMRSAGPGTRIIDLTGRRVLRVLPRAREIAGKIAALSPLTAKLSRLAVTQLLRRLVAKSVPFGLTLETLSAVLH